VSAVVAAGDAVVVTGVAGGLGSALAAAFADRGVQVVGIDRVAPQDGGGPAVRFDLGRLVRDEAAAGQLGALLAPHLDGRRLVGLVNNAAVQHLGGLDELTAAEVADSLAVNVAAPLLLTKLLAPRLEVAGGTVLNVGSVHARLTKPRFVAYATSKAALVGLTQSLAVDQGGRLRVLALLPAAVDTDMLRAGFADDPGGMARLAAHHPSGTVATPEEVARVAAGLVCDPSPALHGACIDLGGGIAHRLHDPA
jgi:NAD(P)-dependent dehydrogenase (short-subunit alcohol dehydrogenase family)